MPLTLCFAHQFQLGVAPTHAHDWEWSAACPQLQVRLRKDEQQVCDIAMCLLQYGADTGEIWKGLSPAETARESGQEHLANIIEHFAWWRAQQILAKHRSTAATKAGSFYSHLLQRNISVYKLISEFVTPSFGMSPVRTRLA